MNKTEMNTKEFYDKLRAIEGKFSFQEAQSVAPQLEKAKVVYRINKLVREGYLKKENLKQHTAKKFKLADRNQEYKSALELKREAKTRHEENSNLKHEYRSFQNVQDKDYSEYPFSGKIYEFVRHFSDQGIFVSQDFINEKFVSDEIPRYKISVQISKFVSWGVLRRDPEHKDRLLMNKSLDHVPYNRPMIVMNYEPSGVSLAYEFIKAHPGSTTDQICNAYPHILYFTMRKYIDSLRHEGYIKREGHTRQTKYFVTDKDIREAYSKKPGEKGFFKESELNPIEPIKKVTYVNDFNKLFSKYDKQYQKFLKDTNGETKNLNFYERNNKKVKA